MVDIVNLYMLYLKINDEGIGCQMHDVPNNQAKPARAVCVQSVFTSFLWPNLNENGLCLALMMYDIVRSKKAQIYV